MASGTRIVYYREGDQHPSRIPADVVIVIRDKPHLTFKRDGSDVRHVVKIDLHEALCGFAKTLPTIDGLGLPYTSTKVVKPGQMEV
jgi:DnaJ-class molecular chaperone